MKTHLDSNSNKYSIAVLESQVSLYDKNKVLLYFGSMDKYESDNPAAAFIKRARSAMKLTQEKFGELLDCTKSNVSGWENGRHIPSYKVLRIIAEKSGIPLPNGISENDDPRAKIYKTSDIQKQLMIEMILNLKQNANVEYIKQSLEFAIQLGSQEKENAKIEKPDQEEKRKQEDRRRAQAEDYKGEERRKEERRKERSGPPRFFKPH